MNHLKRRRPLGPEGPFVEPVLQDFSQSSSIGPGIGSLHVDYRYNNLLDLSTRVNITVPLSKLLNLDRQDHQHDILAEAAKFLDVPLEALRGLSDNQHYLHKRPRLRQTSPMPVTYGGTAPQDGHEKSPLIGTPARAGSSDRKSFAPFSSGFASGWTGPRIADCFALCSPAGFDTYQSVPTTEPYHYESGRAVLSGPVVTLQPQSQPLLVPTSAAINQEELFPCNDPELMTQFVATYPPLQPSRVPTLHPPTTREEMIYPGATANGGYDNNAGHSISTPGLGIQSQTPLTNTPARSNVVPGVYAPEIGPSSVSRHSGYMDLAARYDSLQTYDIKDDPDNLDIKGSSGTFDLFPHQRNPPVRRGPFKDHDQREKTARTRKIGSCIRCRMQRIRCNLDPDDEKGPCISCKKIAINSKIWRLSCLRWKINDVKLFKPGQVKGHEWTNRWRDSVVDDIGNWASTEPRVIFVTEGYTGMSVALRVRRFHPQEGDKLERSWVWDGVKKSVKIPPFAIVDMDSAKDAFDSHIKNGLVKCCQHLLGSRETLLRQTYSIALKTANSATTDDLERRLIGSTLELWMSVRLTTKSFEIIGEETLDMPRDLIRDQNSPLHGKIPLPPVMGAQIDSVLIHQIQPHLRRRTLEELQKMTQDKKQKTWLTTYLVTFILLHNIALITKHDAEYARKHGMKRRFAREENVKEYNLGANTLLAYFHYCNKGIYPFSAECKDQELQSLAELDEDAMSFVGLTRQFASEHKQEWEDMWREDDYENDYYYVSQLFEQNWQPRVMT